MSVSPVTRGSERPLPKGRSLSPDPQPTEHVQVLVVGAGPVGLFAALCAARRGLSVLVVDQTFRGWAPGHATLLHPSSLALLKDGGLANKLRTQGQHVDRVTIHVDGTPVTTVELPAAALAVRQTALEEVLLTALRDEKVEIRAPHQATTLEHHENHVDVRVMRRELVGIGSPADYSDWESVDSSIIRADFVIGADGYDSRVRAALGIEAVDVGETENFAIFEFPSDADPGSEAMLCFNGGLGGVMLPLAARRARWAFQIDDQLDVLPDIGRLRALLALRAPSFVAGTARVDWGTVIHFERRLARRFGRDRTWLAGDAAHVTSPLGGHSMNAGLVEAHDLTRSIAAAVLKNEGPAAILRYGVEREREWHKLLGLNVQFDLLPHAPAWLAAHARHLVPALPVSGSDLTETLARLGLRLT